MKEELYLELRDDQWPWEGVDHHRQIVRAIVFDDAGQFYFVRVQRNDIFGNATLIETSGGGVEEGEDILMAIQRELQEELGAEVQVLCKIGVVSDYYNLIRRHNINHYFLCRVKSFGQPHMTQDEVEQFHLSTLKLSYADALQEYADCAHTPIGKLLSAREVPVLRRAYELFKVIEIKETAPC